MIKQRNELELTLFLERASKRFLTNFKKLYDLENDITFDELYFNSEIIFKMLSNNSFTSLKELIKAFDKLVSDYIDHINELEDWYLSLEEYTQQVIKL